MNGFGFVNRIINIKCIKGVISMRKIVIGLVVLTLIVSTSTVYAFAICNGSQNQMNQSGKENTSSYFVDKDNDGVCDNKGICDKALYFVDTNNDGACDNQNNRLCPQDGTGRQFGKKK